MSITYAPHYPLYHQPRRRPRSRPPRYVSDPVRLGLVAAILGALVALGAGVHLLDARSAARLDAAMAAPARALLPGGRVATVTVDDGPALLAEHRPQVRRATMTGRTGDGHAAYLVVREYDRTARVAGSVSWQIGELPMPAGWRPVGTPSAHPTQVEREIDGKLVRLTATAAFRGDHVLVVPGQLTVDGDRVPLVVAPPAVRAAVEPVLVPHRVTVPVPGAEVSVHSAWFGDDGMGVELRASAVAVGGSAAGDTGGR